MRPTGCDTMVALGATTATGHTLFAKNSDRPGDACQPLVLRERLSHPSGTETQCQFVSFPEVATTYRHIGSRPYWCWGYEHGFNEHQVAIGNEGLSSRQDVSSEPKLIGMEILRLGLERARSAAEATEVMTGLISEYGQGKFENDADVRTYDNGYIVTDPNEAYVIQTAGHEWAVERVDGAVGISNAYSVETGWDRLSPGAESHALAQGWWKANGGRFNFAEAYSASNRTEGSGARRLARSCAVLKQRSGRIDVQTMMALLSDHSDGTDPSEPFQTTVKTPPCICIHHQDDGTGGNTAASLVADLCADGSRLPVYWCSLYSPCLGLFYPAFLEGELPSVLSIGDASPSDESPWWGFHRLSRSARSQGETRVSRVREGWAPLQQRLFGSAYEMAAEGKRLSDEGRSEDASRLLSDYMSEAVSDMMTELSRILGDLGDAPSETNAGPTDETEGTEGLPF